MPIRPARSEAEAEALALATQKRLLRAPNTFEDVQRVLCEPQLCQAGASTVTNGAAFSAIYAELAKLHEGELAPRPAWTPIGYLIYKRVAPTPSQRAARVRNFM